MRHAVWRIAASLLAMCAVEHALANARLGLPERVEQGALVIGQAKAGDQLWLGERALRVDPDGRFVFGVGRDAKEPVTLRLQRADGGLQSVSIDVAPRAYPIERVDGVPQGTVSPAPEVAARIAAEQAAVAAARQRDDPRSDFASPFSWPTRGRVSGVFGSQRIYNGEPRAPHSGVDIAAPSRTPLRAPAPGIVSFAADDLYLTGGTVLIDHGHGVSSVFLHLSRIDVAVGDVLAAGDVFGAVGATGRATGPHMHWGLNWFEVRLDPQLLEGLGVP